MRRWEEVATGKENFDAFYQGQLRDLTKFLEKAKNGYFWGCSGFPECKTTAKNDKDKPIFSINKTL